MDTHSTIPTKRVEFGFSRTSCACRKCSVFCEHMPGFLVPSDLTRLIPPDADPFLWAETHLRASFGALLPSPEGMRWIPSLVPAKAINGHCHWLKDGHCEVHEVSPYGCAFLDQHMSNREAQRRWKAGREARWDEMVCEGLYEKLWVHLSEKDLVYSTGDEDRKRISQALAEIRQREDAVTKAASRKKSRIKNRIERKRKKAARKRRRN